MTLPPGHPHAMRLVSADADERLERDLDTRLRTLEAAARRTRHGDDGEAVHDLRVATRRLGAALELWAPRLGPTATRRARRRVRRLRRDLRTARDLEVAHAGILARLPGAEPDARVALEALATRVSRRLGAATVGLGRRVRRARITRIRRAVTRVIATRAHAALDPAALTQLARTHVADRRATALAAIATAAAHGATAAWHEARLDIKRWRYAAECARALLDGVEAGDAPRETLLSTLKSIQESLGHVQDLEVLAGIVRARIVRAQDRELHAEATALTRVLETLVAEQRAATAEAYRLGTTLSAGIAAGA